MAFSVNTLTTKNGPVQLIKQFTKLITDSNKTPVSESFSSDIRNLNIILANHESLLHKLEENGLCEILNRALGCWPFDMNLLEYILDTYCLLLRNVQTSDQLMKNRSQLFILPLKMGLKVEITENKVLASTFSLFSDLLCKSYKFVGFDIGPIVSTTFQSLSSLEIDSDELNTLCSCCSVMVCNMGTQLISQCIKANCIEHIVVAIGLKRRLNIDLLCSALHTVIVKGGDDAVEICLKNTNWKKTIASTKQLKSNPEVKDICLKIKNFEKYEKELEELETNPPSEAVISAVVKHRRVWRYLEHKLGWKYLPSKTLYAKPGITNHTVIVNDNAFSAIELVSWFKEKQNRFLLKQLIAWERVYKNEDAFEVEENEDEEDTTLSRSSETSSFKKSMSPKAKPTSPSSSSSCSLSLPKGKDKIKNSAPNSMSVIAEDENGGVVEFSSQSECAEYLGVSRSRVSECISGLTSSTGKCKVYHSPSSPNGSRKSADSERSSSKADTIRKTNNVAPCEEQTQNKRKSPDTSPRTLTKLASSTALSSRALSEVNYEGQRYLMSKQPQARSKNKQHMSVRAGNAKIAKLGNQDVPELNMKESTNCNVSDVVDIESQYPSRTDFGEGLGPLSKPILQAKSLEISAGPSVALDRFKANGSFERWWSYLMRGGLNILLHGFGSKFDLLEEFKRCKLVGKVICLNVQGWEEAISVQDILNLLAHRLLNKKMELYDPNCVTYAQNIVRFLGPLRQCPRSQKKITYNQLKSIGWTHAPNSGMGGLGSWIYRRPGVEKLSAQKRMLGVHMFEDEDEAVAWAVKHHIDFHTRFGHVDEEAYEDVPDPFSCDGSPQGQDDEWWRDPLDDVFGEGEAPSNKQGYGASGGYEVVVILIHSLDGNEQLRSPQAQAALAMLATSRRLRFLCSVDHMNASMLWNRDSSEKFSWVWEKANTYVSYDLEGQRLLETAVASHYRTKKAQLVVESNEAVLDTKTISNILSNIAVKHRKTLAHIVMNTQNIMEEEQESSSSSSSLTKLQRKGVSFGHLFSSCQEKLVFKRHEDKELRKVLQELNDQRLITGHSDFLVEIPVVEVLFAKFPDLFSS